MANLKPLQTLQSIIARELPGAHATVDAPQTETGSWFLDVEWNGAIAIIEWRPAEGFGVASDESGYGEGPELVTLDAEEAALAAVARLRTTQVPIARVDGAASR